MRSIHCKVRPPSTVRLVRSLRRQLARARNSHHEQWYRPLHHRPESGSLLCIHAVFMDARLLGTYNLCDLEELDSCRTDPDVGSTLLSIISTHHMRATSCERSGVRQVCGLHQRSGAGHHHIFRFSYMAETLDHLQSGKSRMY